MEAVFIIIVSIALILLIYICLLFFYDKIFDTINSKNLINLSIIGVFLFFAIIIAGIVYIDYGFINKISIFKTRNGYFIYYDIEDSLYNDEGFKEYAVESIGRDEILFINKMSNYPNYSPKLGDKIPDVIDLKGVYRDDKGLLVMDLDQVFETYVYEGNKEDNDGHDVQYFLDLKDIKNGYIVYHDNGFGHHNTPLMLQYTFNFENVDKIIINSNEYKFKERVLGIEISRYYNSKNKYHYEYTGFSYPYPEISEDTIFERNGPIYFVTCTMSPLSHDTYKKNEHDPSLPDFSYYIYLDSYKESE